MPYKSAAQRGYFHAHKAEMEAQGVNVSEWDQASKGKKLPYHVKKSKGGALDGAMRTAKKYASGGGMDSWMEHQASRNLHFEGMIKSPVPGRTDKLPMSVPAGAYVLPADIPSALGQGNSQAGGHILQKMFSSGPGGMPLPHIGGGKPNMPRLPRAPAAPPIPKPTFADGGDTEEGGGTVKIVAAGGEFIIHPDVVKMLGAGDIKKGHKILDAFCIHVRKKHIETLRKLPPPKK
jgi:hypothetical protein